MVEGRDILAVVIRLGFQRLGKVSTGNASLKEPRISR